MVNYHETLIQALNAILPTHYEMNLTSKTTTPCISYMETNNYDAATGNTVGFSRVSYQIKVWGRDLPTLQNYASQIDKSLHSLGFRRVSSREMYDNNSTMKQKVMTYEALFYENY